MTAVQAVSGEMVEFLRWLVTDHGFTAEQLLDVIERPDRWLDEMLRMRISKSPAPWRLQCPRCDHTDTTSDAADIDWLSGLSVIECPDCEVGLYVDLETDGGG